MSIPDTQIRAVKRILTDWNPLGDESQRFPDLNEYNTEAIDILFHLKNPTHETDTTNTVRQILNEAFDLDLTREDCTEAARDIVKIAEAK